MYSRLKELFYAVQPAHPFALSLPPGADVVAGHLAALSSALDWTAAARHAQPLVQAVRNNPPQFWAMENLLKEYPITSAEGLTLMRLAEALLRVPDADTAIALTADQLGRADFDGATDGPCSRVMARLSASAIDLSKKFSPEGGQLTPMSRLGAQRGGRHAAGRAALGRQFVLGQTIGEAMKEASNSRRHQLGFTRFSRHLLRKH